MPSAPPKHTRTRAAPLHVGSRPRDKDRRGSSAKRGYGAGWRRLRAQVIGDYILMSGPFCECGCGQRFDRSKSKTAGMPYVVHLDHKIPKEQGGTDAVENLQCLRPECHSRKTAKEDGGYGNRQQAAPITTK